MTHQKITRILQQAGLPSARKAGGIPTAHGFVLTATPETFTIRWKPSKDELDTRPSTVTDHLNLIALALADLDPTINPGHSVVIKRKET